MVQALWTNTQQPQHTPPSSEPHPGESVVCLAHPLWHHNPVQPYAENNPRMESLIPGFVRRQKDFLRMTGSKLWKENCKHLFTTSRDEPWIIVSLKNHPWSFIIWSKENVPLPCPKLFSDFMHTHTHTHIHTHDACVLTLERSLLVLDPRFSCSVNSKSLFTPLSRAQSRQH